MWILPALFCHPDNTRPQNRTSGLPMHIEPRIKAQQKSTVLSFRYPNMLPGYSIRQYREYFHRNISGNLLVTELDLFKMRTCQSCGVQQRGYRGDLDILHYHIEILTFNTLVQDSIHFQNCFWNVLPSHIARYKTGVAASNSLCKFKGNELLCLSNDLYSSSQVSILDG